MLQKNTTEDDYVFLLHGNKDTHCVVLLCREALTLGLWVNHKWRENRCCRKTWLKNKLLVKHVLYQWALSLFSPAIDSISCETLVIHFHHKILFTKIIAETALCTCKQKMYCKITQIMSSGKNVKCSSCEHQQFHRGHWSLLTFKIRALNVENLTKNHNINIVLWIGW